MPPTGEEVSVGEATSPVEASSVGRTSLVEVLAADPISAAPVILQAEALIFAGLWLDLALLAASGIAAPVPGTADPVLGMRAIGMATITSPTTTFMITSTIAS
jgi:hypothetical protein